MTNPIRSSLLRTGRGDIFAVVASLALTACPHDSQTTGKVDAPVEAGSPQGSNDGPKGSNDGDGPVPDATDDCTGLRTWRYDSPGCGARTPARVCGGALDAACLGGYICTCAGKWKTTCFRALTEPWSYLVPPDKVPQGQAPVDGTPCDPAVVPDGGIVPDGPS
jgi:hypothetical protein